MLTACSLVLVSAVLSFSEATPAATWDEGDSPLMQSRLMETKAEFLQQPEGTDVPGPVQIPAREIQDPLKTLIGNTCRGPTCDGGETCPGEDTCIGTYTCFIGPTCEGGETCDGSDTCSPATCAAFNTCGSADTCLQANTCNGSRTCNSTNWTCKGSTCYITCFPCPIETKAGDTTHEHALPLRSSLVSVGLMAGALWILRPRRRED